jgi:G:T/U-mismatch repair DNA glycosylase
VAKLRDNMNYSRKAIVDTSKCLIKPMNRHWKCMNTATQVNKKYKQLVDVSYIKLKESRLAKLRAAEEERKRKAAEKRRKQREARARIAKIKSRFDAAKAKEKREIEIAA